MPALVDAARALTASGTRRLLGLTGSPGAGKSTLAAALCAELGPLAARVPMDGFHLADQVLRQLGLTERKGSPPSFDVGGFHALLRRLRANTEDVVYAPEFVRELEEPIAGALPIPRTAPLVIIEGNYLLLAEGRWQHTAALLDEIWYLRPEEALRRQRLIARHREHGRSAAEAAGWVAANDEPNAQLVAATAARADRIITVPDTGLG
ncbi:MAG TPA: nucleoside/nucleotide kinase family protein [Pseudonocardiaceae bacterium]|nr:nucleoside/nucleotide kinase family protein [Pseudonocardiaceae bacterium]